jgi:TRAP-type C4-dicarboxylate transport system permease large subunit
VAAFYALLLGFFYREIKIADLPDIILLLLVTLFPQLTMFLPSLILGMQ